MHRTDMRVVALFKTSKLVNCRHRRDKQCSNRKGNNHVRKKVNSENIKWSEDIIILILIFIIYKAQYPNMLKALYNEI